MRFPGVSSRSLLPFGIAALLTLVLLTITVGGYIVSRDSIRHAISAQTLPLTADNIYSEIQKDLLRPVFISSLMAHDTFVRDWILGGEVDARRAVRYLDEVKRKYGTVTAFLVSDRSRKYYHADGILKTIKESEPVDKWFFRVRAMAAPYETNIDPDMANRDAMTIFINYRVLDYEGRFIGATGVGLTLDTVSRLIDRYQRQFDRRIYFVDGAGTIVLAGKSMSDIRGSIRDLPGMRDIAPLILAKREESVGFEYVRDSAQILLNARFIPELGWYLIVEQDERSETAAVRQAFFINLSIAGLTTLLVFAIVVPAFKRNRDRIEAMAHEAMLRAAYETERAAAQQQFVAMVSHEFRTPLAIIDASLQSLELFDASLPDDVRSRHHKMRRASVRLQDLITNYLTGDHLREERPTVRREPVSVDELLNQQTKRIDAARVHVENEADNARVIGDAELLRIALGNLIGNALKYSPEEQPIRLAARTLDDWLEIEVVDRGQGIRDEDLPRIFDKYYRAAGNTASGAGLGLYLVKRIVELHGGSVSASSVPGAGTTMRVRLPLAPAA